MSPDNSHNNTNEHADVSLAQNVSQSIDALRVHFADRCTLLFLELQQAGLSAALMLALVLTAGLLVAGGWLLALGAMVLWVARSGIGYELAMLVCAALQVLAAGAALLAARQISRQIGLPRSLAQLRK